MTRRVAVFSVFLVMFVAGCSTTKASQPAKTVLSSAAYQHLLTGIETRLGHDNRLMSAALSPGAVSLVVTATEGDVSSAVTRLSQVSAPTSMKAGQAGLIAALRAYGRALSGAGQAVSLDQICAGSAELEQISQSSGATKLRATVLASAAPQAIPDAVTRLPNGTVIRREKQNGLGELTIINTGGNTDAVLDLVLAGRVAALAVYVRAASTATVKNVPNGNYQVYIATGAGWDPVNHLFTRACGYQKQDSTVAFTTSTHGNTTDYVDEQITITPVVNGNVQLSKVPPDQFPES
jgi:hypothetical protein